MTLDQFSNRTVIVTGGTKGLGRVLTKGFLDAGANVVICARNEPESAIESSGRVARFIAADVREPDQVQGVIDFAVTEFGRVDVLINNAGGAPPADSATVSPRFNERIIALNLLAPMTFSQAAYRQMKGQADPLDGGSVIINISSVSGGRPNPLGVAYGAAKAGLVNMTQTLAHEWGPKVRVLTLTVGLIVTEEADLYYGDETGIEQVGQVLAAKRMGTPADIAPVCVFLASPSARWMTGTNVEVHGGGEIASYLAASNAEATS